MGSLRSNIENSFIVGLFLFKDVRVIGLCFHSVFVLVSHVLFLAMVDGLLFVLVHGYRLVLKSCSFVVYLRIVW